jgi:hypothetical protein
MKIIPFSSIMEFQRESQKTVRGTGFLESAVWAVFAASTAVSILFSLSQIAPASAQSDSPKDSGVVCDQQTTRPIYTVQNT